MGQVQRRFIVTCRAFKASLLSLLLRLSFECLQTRMMLASKVLVALRTWLLMTFLALDQGLPYCRLR